MAIGIFLLALLIIAATPKFLGDAGKVSGSPNSTAAMPNSSIAGDAKEIPVKLTVPSTTPPAEPIVLHYGLSELVLKRTGNFTYEGILNASNYNVGSTVAYGYSRGGIIAFGECGFMGIGGALMPRNFTVGVDTQINDKVTCWKWLPGNASEEPLIPTQAGGGAFEARPRFWKGAYLPDFWSPEQAYNYNQTIAHMKQEGFDWIAIKPPVSESSSDPVQYALGQRINCPSFPNDTLKDEIHAFKHAGMHVLLEVQLCSGEDQYQNKNSTWWQQWFSQVKQVVQYHAKIAKDESVDAFVLQFDGALPLATGSPNFSSEEWSQIIDIARTSGANVSFSSGAWGADTADPHALPYPLGSVDFINRLDFLEVGVQNTLFLNNSYPTQADIDAAIEKIIGRLDYLHNLTGKPVLIAPVSYSSTDGAGLKKGPEVLYAYMDPSKVYSQYNVAYNDTQQAMIYEAIMRSIASRPYIIGIFTWGYGYVDSQLTPDDTIRGKMAERVLSRWFSNLSS